MRYALDVKSASAGPAGRQWAKAFEVDAGFLQGARLEFDPRLNCIIGGRGTGKTTVIELLRFALKETIDPQRKKAFEALIRKNLDEGTVKVAIETREGVGYTVQRQRDEPARVRDGSNNPVGFKLTHGVIFGADIYGWLELESIARDRAAQRDLLDRFEEEKLAPVKQQLARLAGELATNAAEIGELTRECQLLEEGLGDLPQLQRELDDLTRTGGTASDELQRELDLKGTRDYELRTLDGIDKFLEEKRASLAALGRELSPVKGLVPRELLDGPNAEHFRSALERLNALDRDLTGFQRQTLESLDACASDLSSLRSTLVRLHATQEDRYQAVLGQREEEKGRAGRRVERQKRVNELLGQRNRLEQRRMTLEVLREKRKELLRQARAQRELRFKLRKAVADRVNRDLEKVGVSVKVSQGGDPQVYREALGAVLRAASLQKFSQHAEKICEHVRPADLIKHAEAIGLELAQRAQGSPDHAGLASKASAALEKAHVRSGVPLDRLRAYLEALARSPGLLGVEAAEVEDLVTISLKDGDQTKTTDELSAGQRCTALLPIVLLESDRPLVIDQPEDCLDNRFITKTLISSILAAKQRRQLIFVTHNPNIPVLGFAERLFLLESSGERATVKAGTVDGLREDVETNLEGGREAFLERARRYKHKL